MKSITQEIREKILKLKPGSVIAPIDFKEIANEKQVYMILSRLETDGLIVRLLRGIYYKPEYSKFLKENIAPDPDDVANAIARNISIIIVPTGDTVLNMLGVSTQVVGTYIYVTNGRYNVYKYGNMTITFKRVANKEIVGISKDTAMLGQAIKALGKGNVSQKDLRILRRKFSDETKQKILLEGKQLTAWIYDYIKEICLEE